MPEKVDPVRSRNMAAIKGRDTKPEMLIRRGLHALGFRFRLHVSGLPGKPDIVLPRYRAVIFVNGCFWHGHTVAEGQHCHLFKLPQTRADFWRQKIASNVARDAAAARKLSETGWRQLVVWECALKGRARLDHELLLLQISDWITGDGQRGEVRGDDRGELSGR